jgi:16S rRNA (cytidine1402-2'-O)-methyltransferase
MADQVDSAAEAETGHNRNSVVASLERGPVPSEARTMSKPPRRGQRRVRPTARRTGGARASSGNRDYDRGQPSHREPRSKRSRSMPSDPAEAAPPPSVALPETELAPGLYLVATPIGNLADITLRALAVLRGVDRIYCEDTRLTGKLLAKYRVGTALAAYHDHNADAVRPLILAALRRGERVALVSDAGTPLVSDPGYKLVRAAIADNLTVTAAPGPSAALTALILSGLPPDAFLFAGFLPPRQAARRRVLERWAGVEATLVFFESTPRLAESLADMTAILGNRPAAVARELTKLHEEMRRGPLGDLVDHYRRAGPPPGETAVVVGPPQRAAPPQAEVEARLRRALLELGVRQAAAKLAAETGLSRSDLYRRALAMRSEKG